MRQPASEKPFVSEYSSTATSRAPVGLEDGRRPVPVEREIGVREVVHEHHVALPREVDELLHRVQLDARRRRVVRERAEEHARLRLRRLPRLLHAGNEVERGNALHGRTREARREQMNGIARARHERRIAGSEQHPQEMDEPLLRAERHRRLGLGIELDAVAVAIELAHGGAQVRQPAAGRVAMVARDERGLAQLLDGDLRWGHVRVAEAEVDHVLARTAKLELEPLDLGERVGRQRVDAPELGHAANRRTASDRADARPRRR